MLCLIFGSPSATNIVLLVVIEVPKTTVVVWSTIAAIQHVHNTTARLVLGLSPRDHVSSALQTLHWLPIYYRIQFKIALLMYNAHAGRCPE